MSSLTYIERKPPRPLASLVECLWIVSDPTHHRDRPLDRVLPDGCPEWIVHAGDPFQRLSAQGWTVQPSCFLAGTLTRPWLIRGGSRVRTFGIRFRPGAAATFLKISLSGTADQEIDLTVLGVPTQSLVDGICRARTTERMFDAAHDALLALATPQLKVAPKTRAATERIRTSKGSVRIAPLAASLGTSRRTLERWFDAELGISPKQYARIVRFNAVLAAVAAGERAQLVELAVEGGYFDEAHLLLDVRRLAGRRLRRDPATDGELARHFIRLERLRELLERNVERRD
jgi:AraC-like DNA-binding protein